MARCSRCWPFATHGTSNAKARALLSYGIFDWAVTAREAWLAYQLVRSLPAANQDRASRRRTPTAGRGSSRT